MTRGDIVTAFFKSTKRMSNTAFRSSHFDPVPENDCVIVCPVGFSETVLCIRIPSGDHDSFDRDRPQTA